jgi:chromosome segregation ATPase
MAPRTVKVDDDREFPVGRLTFAVMRELEPIEERMTDLMAEVDGVDARLGSVQTRLEKLADDGTANDDAVAVLTEEAKALTRERRQLTNDQFACRLEMLAVRLGTSATELEELVEVDALGRLEDEVANPPVSAREGASS